MRPSWPWLVYGIERDVGDDAEIGKASLERAHRARDESFRIPGLRAVRRLPLARHHREQGERRNRELRAPFGIAQQEVDGLARNAGQRSDGLFALRAVQHEHGIDEIVGREPVLAHEPARKIIAPHAAHAASGILPCEIEPHVGTPVGTHCLLCQTATSPASLPERAPSVVTNPIEGISGPAPFPLDAGPLLWCGRMRIRPRRSPERRAIRASIASAASIPIRRVAENGTTVTCAAGTGNAAATSRSIARAASRCADAANLSILVARRSTGRPLVR